MNDDKIHIVLASDANYLPGLEVTKTTILQSCSAPERIVWHIFDETDLAKLDVDKFSVWNTSKMTWLRLFLPELMPEIDRIVYTDVDTVWLRDVCELWDGTVGNKCGGDLPSIYWVRDFEVTVDMTREWLQKVGGLDFDERRYCCAGVTIMNLQKMREQRLSEKAMELIRKFGTPHFPDQDILNVLYNHDSDLLPGYWDVVGQWRNERGWDRQVGADGKAVYHIIGIGRHFHDETPVDYPSQYDFWNRAAGRRAWDAPMRWQYRLMAACWWASGLVRFLPGKILRCRIYRQWLFARVIKLLAERQSVD